MQATLGFCHRAPLGGASVSAVVRDAQGSPVEDFTRPVDLRLCEAAPTPGGAPICPSQRAALVGDVQALQVAMRAAGINCDGASTLKFKGGASPWLSRTKNRTRSRLQPRFPSC